jgi:hypothetical protein
MNPNPNILEIAEEFWGQAWHTLTLREIAYAYDWWLYHKDR